MNTRRFDALYIGIITYGLPNLSNFSCEVVVEKLVMLLQSDNYNKAHDAATKV